MIMKLGQFRSLDSLSFISTSNITVESNKTSPNLAKRIIRHGPGTQDARLVVIKLTAYFILLINTANSARHYTIYPIGLPSK